MRRLLLTCVTSALGLTSLAIGQIPGTYTGFGAGCLGTGGPGCASNNSGGGTLAAPQNQNTFAIEIVAGSAMLVLGFELYTSGRGTNQTLATHIYLADAQNTLPLATPAVSGTMAIGPSAGWYQTTFATPVTVAQNDKFFLSYTPNSAAHAPFVLGGALWPSWVQTPTNPAWTGPSPAPWAFKVNCLTPGATPQLGNTGLPVVNTSFSVDISLAKANANAGLIFGASKTQSGTLALPFDLTPLGAAGCSLLVSLDVVVPITTDGSGNGSVPVTIPNNPALIGNEFHNQFYVLDSGANTLGIAWSGGGTGKVGG